MKINAIRRPTGVIQRPDGGTCTDPLFPYPLPGDSSPGPYSPFPA